MKLNAKSIKKNNVIYGNVSCEALNKYSDKFCGVCEISKTNSENIWYCLNCIVSNRTQHCSKCAKRFDTYWLCQRCYTTNLFKNKNYFKCQNSKGYYPEDLEIFKK